MSTIQLGTTKTGVESAPFDAAAYSKVTFFATGLAAAEEVAIMIGGGDVLVPATGPLGTAAKLTAGLPAIVLDGGPLYVLQKAATVAPGSMYAAPRNQL